MQKRQLPSQRIPQVCQGEYHQFVCANPHIIWLLNIAMENAPFIDNFPIKTSIYSGFSMAMSNNQMVGVGSILEPRSVLECLSGPQRSTASWPAGVSRQRQLVRPEDHTLRQWPGLVMVTIFLGGLDVATCSYVSYPPVI